MAQHRRREERRGEEKRGEERRGEEKSHAWNEHAAGHQEQCCRRRERDTAVSRYSLQL
jgi:hypothetical protein